LAETTPPITIKPKKQERWMCGIYKRRRDKQKIAETFYAKGELVCAAVECGQSIPVLMEETEYGVASDVCSLAKSRAC